MSLFTLSRLNIIKITCRNFGFSQASCTRVGRHVRPALKDIYSRRLEAGPEIERPRSAFHPWDYNAELFAFANRLKEKFNDELLRDAFVNHDNENNVKQVNESLIEIGKDFSQKWTLAFLRFIYPHLPEEYLESIVQHLLSIEHLAFVGAHIGVKDLIYSNDFPLELTTISNTFLAILGALRQSHNDDERAFYFLRDFVFGDLCNKDVNMYFKIEDPLTLLRGVLRVAGFPPFESRLIQQSAPFTILPCYHVGIYSGHDLLARSAGESEEIAEEEAAREALKVFFGTSDNRSDISFTKVNFQSINTEKRNVSIQEYLKEETDSLT